MTIGKRHVDGFEVARIGADQLVSPGLPAFLNHKMAGKPLATVICYRNVLSELANGANFGTRGLSLRRHQPRSYAMPSLKSIFIKSILIKSTLVVAAALLAGGAIAQPPDPRPAPPPIAVKAPKDEVAQVVMEFVEAISFRFDLEAAARLVEGGQTGEALKPIIAELQKERGGGWTIDLLDAAPQVNDSTASVKLKLMLYHRLLGKIMHQERLTLRKGPKGWKIVPLSAEELYHARNDSFDSDIVANFATYLALPKEAHNARACLNKLKQLGLAAMQFVQDWDEIFAFNATTYQEKLAPYTRSKDVFFCPDDKSGQVSYNFNARLENISLAGVDSPSETVLIYEGKNQQLEFRHNNRAAVCFADGHCKLVTPEEAKTLRWKP